MKPEVYEQIKIKIERSLGINLDPYKEVHMRRRLDAWLARSGAIGWDEYFIIVNEDKKECMRFRDYITINVTEFLRDKDKWAHLRECIFPEMLKETAKFGGTEQGLRIWSAGCSIGAEPFSLAMILDEISRGRMHYILATDLDRGALAKARAGGPYLMEEMNNLTPSQMASYLQPGGPPHHINQKLVSKVTFKEHNLLSDPYDQKMDLIICRNVVIYFKAEAKEHIFKNFHDALRPGGYLFLGGTEIILRPKEIGFASNGISFYKRID